MAGAAGPVRAPRALVKALRYCPARKNEEKVKQTTHFALNFFDRQSPAGSKRAPRALVKLSGTVRRGRMRKKLSEPLILRLTFLIDGARA